MTKPIFPWMGGKGKMADNILPYFPEHTCYVEAFAGGAALYFKKERSKAEVLNDINLDIVNLYRVVQNHFEELLKQFKWALHSRQIFEWEQLKHPETLTDIQRAARFLYLQKTGFGGMGKNFGVSATSGHKLNIMRLEENLTDAYLRLADATIERMDWKDLIKRYDRPDTFFYLDPPYWQTEGYGVDFGWEHYESMLELSQSIEGKLMISINDHPDIMALFESLYSKGFDYTYTVGGGHNQQPVVEMLFANFELKPSVQPALDFG